jgi:hypothetical protein
LTHWIDETDRAIVQRELEVIGPGQDTKPGSTVKIMYAKNADGTWLAQRTDTKSISSTGSPNGFVQTNVYSDYRKFAAKTTVQFEDTP